MRRFSNAFLFVASLALAASAAAKADKPFPLMAGDPAPKLTVSKWVKGSPVKGFDKDKTYVVEFWATWCGPCKESIPHLTELQKKYKDVKFIGVSVFESEQKAVEPFVKNMGAKMDYTVAMDSIPAGQRSDSGFMAKNWMIDAGQDGIPTAFIIKNSRVAWIGHPMAMEETLDKVVKGTWDIDAYAKQYAEERANDAKVQEINGRLMKALQGKDWPGVYGAMRELYEGPLHNNAMSLNQLAWMIVDPESKMEQKDLDLALAMAQRAVELSEKKDFASLDTLANAYFLKGDKQKAIETEELAISLAPDEQKAELQKSLERFKS